MLVGFMEGANGVEASRLSAAERRALVTRQVERGLEGQDEPSGYVDRDWAAEEWTRGCYGGHFPPGVWTQVEASLRDPTGRIHWAGTETAQRWMGYVDGAIESGTRAAVEILEGRSEPAPGRAAG